MESEYPEGAVKVLDHGFVKLVDHMGDDSSIVQAARVSYGKGTKQVNEDRGLIRYLLRHAHTTPFEMVEFKFHCKMPIFVARQWIRHRTASVNEVSGRYSEVKDECYLPEANKITAQSKDNKQGSSDEVIANVDTILDLMQDDQRNAFLNYDVYLKNGVSKERARINLPLAAYTEWYWKINCHNLFHFLRLRLDAHAQYEIRVYGEAIAQLIKPIIPMAWEAFEDYQLNTIKLSKLEIDQLSFLLKDLTVLSSAVTSDIWYEKFGNKREAEEFIQKLKKLQNG